MRIEMTVNRNKYLNDTKTILLYCISLIGITATFPFCISSADINTERILEKTYATKNKKISIAIIHPHLLFGFAIYYHLRLKLSTVLVFDKISENLLFSFVKSINIGSIIHNRMKGGTVSKNILLIRYCG